MQTLKTILISVFIATFLNAGQTGKIAGKVTDSQTGEALVGCNVIVMGTHYGASTDANGEFFIINLGPGTYDLKFSMIGYAEYTAVGVTVNVDVTTPIDANLTSQALEMAGVTVTAEKPVIERTLTSSKQILAGSLTTDLAVNDVEDLVKTLPGVTEEGGKLHLRGGRTGEEMFLVDGASVVSPIMGGEAFEVIPSMIEELQVITGTFNAEYGQAMSGLFNTVLKDADQGVHATIRFQTSMGSDYFKEEKGAFKDMDVYGESLYNTSEDSAVTAVKGTDYSKGKFGGSETIMDGSFSVGSGDLGLMTTFRKLSDPGRLPGLAEDYQSIMAKLTYQLGGNLKLGAEMMSHTHDHFYDPTYDAMKVAGASGEMLLWDWKYAMEQYPRTEEKTLQFGVTADYVLSPNTHFTARLDVLNKTQEDGAKTGGKFVTFEDANQVVTPMGDTYNGEEGPNHTKIIEDTTNSNAWFGIANVYGHYFKSDEKHTTVGLTATSQMNARHLIKGGFEYRMFDINRIGHDVWFGRTVGFEVKADTTKTRLQSQNIQDVSPWEMVAYVQDQMEFNDMVVNVGFRYDAFNTGADKGVWDVSENGETVFENVDINPFDPSLRRATETKSKISPRLGISFPVGDNMAFRYAYGTFFQRPTFYDLLENYLVQMDGGTESGYFVYIGNANLDPQETTIYEMGLQYSVAGGYKVDVSGYYKDISNLMAMQEVFNKAYIDSGQSGVGNWTSDDNYQASHYFYKTSEHFGNIRGLEISVSKTGATGLTGRASYTFSIARGTASDKLNQGAGSYTQDTGSMTGNYLTMTTLDWHRPHIFNGYLDYHIPMSGMISAVGGNITFNAQSGLPVTARSGAAGASLAERAPSTLNIDLRLDAKLDMGTVRPTVYLLIENVINKRNVISIADPASYFDSSSNFSEVAAGPRNNLMAYGSPITIHLGVSIDY